MDFLHPEVRQEHVPQSPVPQMGSEPMKDSKSPLAPQPRARLWWEFPTSQGRRSVQVGGPGCSLTSEARPFCASRLQSLPRASHKVMTPTHVWGAGLS